MEDVINAYAEIEAAERRYREVVRQALASGVRQVDIAKALDLTREKIRRDALPENQLEQLKQADRERHRRKREAVKMASKKK